MTVAPGTSRSIRAAVECGRVATCGARGGARRSRAHPPCQRPEAVCPRHKDREVIRTKCIKSHTSSHPLSWPTKQVDAETLGEAGQPLVASTGLLWEIVTSPYSKWFSNIWCCYDTLPAFEWAPVSTTVYIEWMIPPKCILEFCTNTFSELSKQCRPLSRCIVCVFFFVVALHAWDEQVSERAAEGKRERVSLTKRHQLHEEHGQIFHSVSIFLFTCLTDS